MSDKMDYEVDNAIAEGMDSALAEAVRKFPILYDKTHKHRFQSVYPEQHEQAWSKISDELSLEVESCKSLWSCMKQKFIKHRKRLDKGEAVSSWPAYDELEKWLNQHVKKRRTRHDFIKQMRASAKLKKSETTAEPVSEYVEEEEEADAADEEWTDFMEDKETMVKIQLKRKDLKEHGGPSTSTENKKKFKIEVISEQGTEVFNEFTEVDEIEKADNVVHKVGTPSRQIELIELKEASVGCGDDSSTRRIDASLESNLGKLEQVLVKCVHMVEKTMLETLHTDSTDTFGKYIASLVRELPLDKRVKVQFNILQYATEVIRKESMK